MWGASGDGGGGIAHDAGARFLVASLTVFAFALPTLLLGFVAGWGGGGDGAAAAPGGFGGAALEDLEFGLVEGFRDAPSARGVEDGGRGVVEFRAEEARGGRGVEGGGCGVWAAGGWGGGFL